jgi:bifunctional UDP-N-acetylglucosamine pyrophosphorylase/glucosamine-1-phosphate N-acetyltransferase
MAYEDKLSVASIAAPYSYEVMGVNNKLQLEELERIHQVNLANQLLLNGVTLIDKKRIDIRGEVVAGQDCIIDVNCIFEGKVTLGNNVTIGAGCIVKDTSIADNVIVQAYSIIDGAQIGEHAHIGPYARLRPATKLSAGARVGNFVEIKKSTIGVGSKVNHLTYVGDSTIGNAVNIGAGTVTCNYDGQNKFNTIIGDNVFIGSGSMLVAPVTIGDNALIAAGSVITKNAPDNELTVSRAKQITIVGWKKRTGMKE